MVLQLLCPPPISYAFHSCTITTVCRAALKWSGFCTRANSRAFTWDQPCFSLTGFEPTGQPLHGVGEQEGEHRIPYPLAFQQPACWLCLAFSLPVPPPPVTEHPGDTSTLPPSPSSPLGKGCAAPCATSQCPLRVALQPTPGPSATAVIRPRDLIL